MNASVHEKTIRLMNAVAAGQSDQDGTGVDTSGFEGVKFYFSFGTIDGSAVTSCKAAQSDDDGSSDAYSDLLGSDITVADDDDNQVVVLDIYRPRKKWVRPTILRGTANAVIDGVIAVLYGPSKVPTIDDASTVVAREVHVSPAEGTA